MRCKENSLSKSKFFYKYKHKYKHKHKHKHKHKQWRSKPLAASLCKLTPSERRKSQARSVLILRAAVVVGLRSMFSISIFPKGEGEGHNISTKAECFSSSRNISTKRTNVVPSCRLALRSVTSWTPGLLFK